MPLGFEIERLPARHAAGAGSRGKGGDQRHLAPGRQFRSVIREDTKSIGQQAVAGKDGGRLVEGLVDRRQAAPQIVVVHRRQIVMDQRIAMDAFERRGDSERRLSAHRKKRRAFHHQKRPEPLAAAQLAVPDRLHEARRPHDLAGACPSGEQSLHERLDLGGARRQHHLERGIGIRLHGASDGGNQRRGQETVSTARISTRISDRGIWATTDHPAIGVTG